MIDPKPDAYETFLQYFTRDQLRIVGYIRTLIHDQSEAADVFQETSLALWRNFDTYDRNQPFGPWAMGVARNQVLKHWRTRHRDRHVFSDALMSELSSDAVDMAAEMPDRQQALDACIKLVSDRNRDLLRMFYTESRPAQSIADEWNKSIHAVYKALKTVRRFLADCVDRKLAHEV